MDPVLIMPLTVLILYFNHKLKRPDLKGGKLLKKNGLTQQQTFHMVILSIEF